MADISNLSIYLSRMDAALLDKCWWIDKIPDTIDTIIDFGCASGNLKSMIDHLAPNKYKYIGVDNSSEMPVECAKKGIRVYTSLYDAAARVESQHTILVLNSVIHEILSYTEVNNIFKLFDQMAEYGFAYIAIRDMYLTPGIVNYKSVFAQILNSPYKEQWDQFQAVIQNRMGITTDPQFYTKEFLLKYWYTENWDRECKEQYLWDWKYCFDLLAGPYDIEYENDFYIPFIRNKVKQDFDYDFNVNTHKKLLLKRNDI
jgi:SAM-dependent methyltransferase